METTEVDGVKHYKYPNGWAGPKAHKRMKKLNKKRRKKDARRTARTTGGHTVCPHMDTRALKEIRVVETNNNSKPR